ncbi:YoaK family protein [Streptomyces sp. NPDC001194]|uniref:YoaK family protein n=1 Tax=Streptomyces sp. NPDC001194 TaxID=3364547 RepID=UPI003680FFFE
MTAGAARRGVLHRLAGLLFPPGPQGGSGPHGVLPTLLVALTFVSGVVDAVSYLGLDHTFVANMTGNVVFLGFALAGDRQLSATASLLALGAFLAGATAAGRLRRGREPARTFAPLVSAQAVLVAGALALSAGGAGALPVVGLLALGMGLQNAVVHGLGVPDLTTTVVTRTLTGLAADPWDRASVRRAVSVAVLFCGALAGGLLTIHHGARWALALAVALLLGIVLAGAPRAAGPRRRPPTGAGPR